MRPLTGHRRRSLGALAVLVLTASIAVSINTPPARACDARNPNCITVGAGDPGATASGGRSDPEDSAQGSDAAASSRGVQGDDRTPGDGHDPASGDADASSSTDISYMCELMLEQNLNTMSADQLIAMMKASGCPASTYVSIEGTWGGTTTAPAPPTSPATLAQQAESSFELPVPVPGRFPAGTMRDGRPYTVVNTHMWFWTDRSVWRALSATARAGGNWATVTATPTRLTFDPGDGGAAVSCVGPGLVFDPDSSQYTYPGSWAPTAEPGGCDYVYRRSSGDLPNEEVTATLSITWDLTWTGSGNTSGTLTHHTTTTTERFVVAELQSVVTG